MKATIKSQKVMSRIATQYRAAWKNHVSIIADYSKGLATMRDLELSKHELDSLQANFLLIQQDGEAAL